MAPYKYKKTSVELTNTQLTLYVGPKVHEALKEVAMDLDLYKGVKLTQVLEAVYEQGKKDGRREVIEAIDKVKKPFNYLPPGRPAKKGKKK